MSSYQEQLERALKEGNLPDFMKEEYQIIEGFDYDKNATEYVKRIIDRLPKKHIKTEAIKIFISADPEPNTYVRTKSTPPILIITKGLFELAKTEDELAAAIAREVMQIDLRGEFKHDNSKSAEIICDLASIAALDTAGYRRDGLLTLNERFPKKEKKEEDEVSTFFDARPRMEIRAKNLGNQLAVYDREHGLSRISTTTPLAPFIAEGKDRAGVVTYPYCIDKRLSEAKYAESSTARKMEILAELIISEKGSFSSAGKEFFTRRKEKILAEFDALTINIKDPEEEKAFGKLVDTYFEVGYGPLLTKLYLKLGIKHSYPPYGKMKAFETLGTQFVEAKTETEANTRAKELNDFIKENKKVCDEYRIRLFNIKFFEIAKPKKPGRFFSTPVPDLPWNRHLSWSKAHPEIRETLYALGVLYVVSHNYPPDEVKDLGYEIADNYPLVDVRYPKGVRSLGSGGEFRNGKFYYKEEKPYISKPEKFSRKFSSYQEEEQRLQARDLEEKEMKIDWSLLDKDVVPGKYVGFTQEFVTQYETQLKMEMSCVDGGFAFAEQVMSKLNDIAAKDPTKADNIFSLILQIYPNHRVWGGEENTHGLGVSTQHPFIQHAFKNYAKFGKLLRERELFLFVNRALFLQLPENKEARSSADNRVVQEYKVIRANVNEYKTGLQKKYQDPEGLLPLEERWHFYDYEKIFGIDRSPLPASLDKKAHTQEEWKAWTERAYTLDNLFKMPSWRKFSLLWAFEAYRIMKHNVYLKLQPDDYALLALSKDSFEHEFAGQMGNSSHGREVCEAYCRELDRHEKKFFQQLLEEKDWKVVIRSYHLLHLSGKLFEDFKNIHRFEDKIKSSFQSLMSLHEKKQFLESLLFSQKLEFNPKSDLNPIDVECNFTDPAFKNWAIAEYTKVLSEYLGKDKNEAKENEIKESKGERLPDMHAEVKQVIEKLPLSVSVPVLRQLADNVCAQRPLSYYIRDQIDHATKDALLKKGVYFGGLGEVLLMEVPKSENKTLRIDTIQFLLSGNDFDVDNYATKVIHDSETNLNQRIKGYTSQGVNFKQEYRENKEHSLDRFRATREFFRDLSFEQQILVVDQLLFPAEKKIPLKEGKQHVLDTLFNTGKSSIVRLFANALLGKKVDYERDDKESRQIVESYLEALEEVAQDPHHTASIEAREKLILSAMLVAHAKSKQSIGPKSGRGEALRQVLDAMGPAGRKLAQSIESHPDTPADIKLAFKSSKTNAAPPARWEVHEWIEQNYTPEQSSEKIEYLGEMLGSGSYGVTMQAFKNSGAETAITFLRPHMLEQSEDEFMILDKAAKILIAKNPVFKPFDDMQAEAAAASKKEVKMDIAARQQGIAEKLYTNLVITVDQLHFTFGVAKWVGHGQFFKETQVIKGCHFNDLDESKELKGIKKETAQALLTAELYLLLTGSPTDNDRHGGQQKISRIKENEIHIGNFDFGGVSLRPQRRWQKQLLGNLVGEAMWEISKPFGAKALDGTLLTRLSEKYVKEYSTRTFRKRDNKDTEYLIGDKKAKRFVGRIKRGLLALGNYLEVLKDEPEKIKGIIGSILATGQIDKTIDASMREKLGIFKGELNKLAESKEAQRITLKHG